MACINWGNIKTNMMSLPFDKLPSWSRVHQANIVPIIISRASDVGHGNAPAILSFPLQEPGGGSRWIDIGTFFECFLTATSLLQAGSKTFKEG
jgi:hypothetical protein